MLTDRRRFLSLGAAGALLTFVPACAVKAKALGDRRFVFILQRGAMDGLHAVPAIGDPEFGAARGKLAEVDGVTKLDGIFGLHPALANVNRMYAANEALFVHAVASPYRDRSHFDGQNVLESGGSAPYRLNDGWMNRLIGLLGGRKAIAFAPITPLVLQGHNIVGSIDPLANMRGDARLLHAMNALYEQDVVLHPLWAEAVATRNMAVELGTGSPANKSTPIEKTARIAAGFLRAPDGPRLAMIETSGWDTHTQQLGRLKTQLSTLDMLIGTLKAELGPVWNETLVIVATEFGRTVAINGTGGTDHGTGSVAMLFGNVQGGRVIADWPGLAIGQRLDRRDLRPTTRLDDVISGAIADHFGISPATAAAALFPDGVGSRRSMQDLIRA